jgi:alkylation response protein AidB-like acyl-CoA dehydrogenase
MSLFNESMEWERSFILATQVGAMARQLEECVAYARKRQQFGKPIGANQSVSNRIADMRVRLETSRLLLYRSAWLKDQGLSAPAEAAMTKLSISEAFSASSLDAIRIHGAIGYLSDHEIERDLRDATGGLIYAGTSDIQRNLISRMTGLEGAR